MVVISGSQEYRKAKRLKDLFKRFTNHQRGHQKRLLHEEGRILLPAADKKIGLLLLIAIIFHGIFQSLTWLSYTATSWFECLTQILMDLLCLRTVNSMNIFWCIFTIEPEWWVWILQMIALFLTYVWKKITYSMVESKVIYASSYFFLMRLLRLTKCLTGKFPWMQAIVDMMWKRYSALILVHFLIWYLP